jgi:hypothetical protein
VHVRPPGWVAVVFFLAVAFWQWINGSTGLLVQKIWSSGSVFEAAGTIFVLS